MYQIIEELSIFSVNLLFDGVYLIIIRMLLCLNKGSKKLFSLHHYFDIHPTVSVFHFLQTLKNAPKFERTSVLNFPKLDRTSSSNRDFWRNFLGWRWVRRPSCFVLAFLEKMRLQCRWSRDSRADLSFLLPKKPWRGNTAPIQTNNFLHTVLQDGKMFACNW